MRKHLVVIVIALLFFALGYSAYNRFGGKLFVKENPHPIEIAGQNQVNVTPSVDPVTAVANFNAEYAPQIELSAANGKWTVNDVAQIAPATLVVEFEDGHNAHVAVLDATQKKVLTVMQDQARFSSSTWQSLIASYGAADYSPKFFTTSVVQSGQIQTYNQLTQVPENVFLKTGTP